MVVFSFFYVAVENTQLIIERDSGACDMYLENISVKEATNLVTNSNFTDTGSDVVINGTFATDTNWSKNSNWTISGGEAISDGTSSATINQSSILTEGVSYKISFEITEYTSGSGYSVRAGAGTTYSTAVTSLGVHTFYQVATGNPLYGDAIYIKASGDTIGKITNVTAEPLGADWSSLDGNIDTYNENGVTITSVNTDQYNRLLQSNVTEDGKSYKVTYTIEATSYTAGTALRYYDGANYVTFSEQNVGTHTFYFTRVGTNNNWYFNLNASSSGSTTDTVTISSIVVQELGEDWTLEDGWSIGENKAIANTTVNLDMYQDCLATNKNYKVSFDVADLEVGGNFLLSDAAFTDIHNITANGSQVVYLKTTTNTKLNIRGKGYSFNITNISVKEVGQDWTVANSDSTQYVEFFGGVGGARIVVPDAATTPILTLTANGITLLAGKHYKLIVDVTVVTGSVKYDVTGTTILYNTTEVKTAYFTPVSDVGLSFYRASSNVDVTFNSVIIQQLDTNGRWVTFADPDSKSVMKQGQVDLEIDSSGNNCGVYQTGLIKPNKLYIITINMKATAAINVEIAASLGTAVSAVIGTETLTTSYKEYSFEYVTPFAVDHDLQIHRLFGSGASQTISIDYVSMNGVDENQWTNDPTWDPFATSLVFVPTLTDESTNNSKQFTLNTSITDGGWDGRSLHGQVIINEFPTEIPAAGVINLKQPDFLEGFYQVEIRGYLGTFYRVLGKCMAHLERASTEDGYNRFESYNDTVTYKAYEE